MTDTEPPPLEKLSERDLLIAAHWPLHLVRLANEEVDHISAIIPAGSWLGSDWWQADSLEAHPPRLDVEQAVSEALGIDVMLSGRVIAENVSITLDFARPRHDASPPLNQDSPERGVQRFVLENFVHVVLSQQAECRRTKNAWDAAKEEAKECKDAYDVACTELLNTIGGFRHTLEEKHPLFDRPKTVQAEQHASAPVDTNWRSVDLADLGIATRWLGKQGIADVGQLCDFTRKQGEYRKIDGLGPVAWTEIDDALLKFWERRKAEGLSHPDSQPVPENAVVGFVGDRVPEPDTGPHPEDDNGQEES